MKKILFFAILLILASCTEPVYYSEFTNLETELMYDTIQLRKSINEMNIKELAIYYSKLLILGRDDTIVYSSKGLPYICEFNDKGKLQIAVNNFSAISLGYVGAAAPCKVMQKSIKLIASENIKSLNCVKNYKWLELSSQTFSRYKKIFKIKKINNCNYKIHGLERAMERGITLKEIQNCIKSPETIQSAKYGRKIHILNDIVVVVEDNKCVTCWRAF